MSECKLFSGVVFRIQNMFHSEPFKGLLRNPPSSCPVFLQVLVKIVPKEFAVRSRHMIPSKKSSKRSSVPKFHRYFQMHNRHCPATQLHSPGLLQCPCTRLLHTSSSFLKLPYPTPASPTPGSCLTFYGGSLSNQPGGSFIIPLPRVPHPTPLCLFLVLTPGSPLPTEVSPSCGSLSLPLSPSQVPSF